MKVRVLAWLGLAVVFALAALAFAAAVAQDAGARVAPERVAQTTEFWIPNLDPNPGPPLLEDLSPGGLLGVTIHSPGEKALGGIRATISPAPDALADPEFFPPDETDVLTRDELLSMLAEWEGERISPPANSPPGKIGDAKVRRVLTDLPPLFVSDDRPERMDLLLDAAPASEVVLRACKAFKADCSVSFGGGGGPDLAYTCSGSPESCWRTFMAALSALGIGIRTQPGTGGASFSFVSGGGGGVISGPSGYEAGQ